MFTQEIAETVYVNITHRFIARNIDTKTIIYLPAFLPPLTYLDYITTVYQDISKGGGTAMADNARAMKATNMLRPTVDAP